MLAAGEFLQELLHYVTQLQELAGVRPKQLLPSAAAPGLAANNFTAGVAGAAGASPKPGAPLAAVIAAAATASGSADEGALSGDGASGRSSDSGRERCAAPPHPKRRRTPPAGGS